jgi:hypothetical protein
MLSEPAVAIGPDDEVVTIGDEDILDDEDDMPSSLDREALTDDAC